MIFIEQNRKKTQITDTILAKQITEIIELKKESNRISKRMNNIRDLINEKLFDNLGTQKSLNLINGNDSIKVSFIEKLVISDMKEVKKELGKNFDKFVTTKYIPKKGFANFITPSDRITKFVSISVPPPTFVFNLKDY